MKTVAIIQARMTSTRLPGKVMLPLAGKPMLQRLMERLARAKTLDEIVVATTTNATDDVIASWCAEQQVACHRGPEHDVLARFAGAALRHEAEVVVRVTSDCPLLEPELVDQMVLGFQAPDGRCDYLSNMLEPTYPYGMAVEVFTARALHEAQAEARDAAEREHVTPFLYWHPERYRLRSMRREGDLSHHRWTVDTAEDFELVRRIFEALYPINPCFRVDDVLALLRAHPDWSALNAHVKQKQATAITQDVP